MGLCKGPDIFQEKMSELMFGLKFARTYLNDLLVVSKDTFESHVIHLEEVFPLWRLLKNSETFF
jgi:hypothetical protein